MAYAGLVVWLIWPMRNLGRLIVQMSTGLVSYRPRGRDHQARARAADGRATTACRDDLRGEIVFDDGLLRVRTSDQPGAARHQLPLRAGQAVALLGSTGSGKTTLVNLLPRFYDYTSGSLTLDGVELKDTRATTCGSQIGIVEQEPFLFSRTIRENITYGVGREVPEAEVEAAAAGRGHPRRDPDVSRTATTRWSARRA